MQQAPNVIVFSLQERANTAIDRPVEGYSVWRVTIADLASSLARGALSRPILTQISTVEHHAA